MLYDKREIVLYLAHEAGEMRRMKIRRIRGGRTWDRVRGRAGPRLFSATTAQFCKADTKLLIFDFLFDSD